ncbi:ferrous iron transport protein B [bacterium]|nr:ferrous iron transport protein B [bacterium]
MASPLVTPAPASAATAAKPLRIALCGNPNSGKTTVFNAMTGSWQKVGNWPGVTVEKKEGRCTFEGRAIHVVDLPGTYSLSPYTIEEIVARNHLLDDRPDVIVQVVDSTNLERNLYYTTQLLELGMPLVLAMNVYDEFEKSGARLDLALLAARLSVPVVTTVGIRGKGIKELLAACVKRAEARDAPRPASVDYGLDLEVQIKSIEDSASLAGLQESGFDRPTRWTAVKLLENDTDVENRLSTTANGEWKDIAGAAEAARRFVADEFQDEPQMVLAQRRYAFIGRVLDEVYEAPVDQPRRITDRIDAVLTHRLFGLPFFFFVIWAMFQLTFTVGSYPQDWIDAGVAWLGEGITTIMGAGFYRDLIVEGALNGVGFVIVFLPNILILFFCISLIEDTGYMARAAFLMDRVMRSVGLQGKSFIPMLMGFGCNVPAIMGTRVLPTERDRLLTMMVNPLMSCSARLPVYILLAGTFFAAEWAGTVIFSMYALGIGLAIFIALLFSRTILRGESSPFVMELPPYRVPTLRGCAIQMWDRGKIFLKKMSTVILIGSVTVWTLSYFPRHADETAVADAGFVAVNAAAAVGETDDLADAGAAEPVAETERDMGESYLAGIGRALDPIFAPLGFDWQTNVAILTGFVAKEIVVSTYGVIYQVGDEVDETSQALRNKLASSSALTPLTALALMAFVLIYTPCLGTMAAIRRETQSWKWTLFSIGYSMLLAYAVAFTIVHGGRLLGFA